MFDPDISPEAVDRLTSPGKGQHDLDSHSYQCEDCGRWITVGPSGVEYGHERGRGDTGSAPRCPRRPDCVDPDSSAPDHDGWVGSEDNRKRGKHA